MGIDNIEELKPNPRELHNPETCGGQGVCLPCSIKAYKIVAQAHQKEEG